METPKPERVSMIVAFGLFLVVTYAGLYWVLKQANWIGTNSYSPGSLDQTWIDANEKVWWIAYPFYPAMRLEEAFRGYTGKPER